MANKVFSSDRTSSVLRDEIRGMIGLQCLEALSTSGQMKISDQERFVYDLYHGENGKASYLDAFFNCEEPFAGLFVHEFQEVMGNSQFSTTVTNDVIKETFHRNSIKKETLEKTIFKRDLKNSFLFTYITKNFWKNN